MFLASTRECVAEGTGEQIVTCVPPNHLKHPLATRDKEASLLPRVQLSSKVTSTAESGPHSRSELIPSNQFRDLNITSAAGSPSPIPTILHPTTRLPKGYTPIPTLLAKSVGNKVTLMKRPADCPGVNNVDVQRKKSTSAVAATKHSTAQSPQSSCQQNSQQMQTQGLQMQVVGHSGVKTPLPKPSHTKPGKTVQKGPAQMVPVAEGLGPQVRKDSSGQVRISVHPVMDQSAAEKIMQQVVILPSNLLIHTAEEKAPSLNQQPPKSVQGPVSSSVNLATNVPGFTIPENSLPVQKVAPLKHTRTARDSSSISSSQQQGALNTERHKAAQFCTHQVSTQSVTSKPFPLAYDHSTSSSVSAEPVQSKDPKQELKTVCIRDSQSILVTTRGGNTGIVKVQTSSDHSVLGSLPTSPVITISPQFKAFLLSKTLPTLSPAVPTHTSLCTNPTTTSISLAEHQKQLPSAIKSTSVFTAVTCSLPITVQGSHTVGTAVALSQGSNTSAGSTVASDAGQLAQVTAAGSQFQVSSVKNTVAVPSLSSSVVPQSLSPTEVIGKTAVKWANPDERAPITKFILVTPSSCSTPNAALSQGTNSPASSRLMFISQPTAASSTTFVGTIPKQAVASGSSGPVLNVSLTSPVSGGISESPSNIKNICLSSGGFVQ